MRRSSLSFALQFFLLLLIIIPAQQAGAAIIDFESLRHDDDQIEAHGHDYYEDGYHLNNNSSVYYFQSFGTEHEKFSGSTALYNYQNRTDTIFTKEDGGAFNLISIDLSEYTANTSMDVVFTGTLLDGLTVSNTFSLDGLSFLSETFYFDDSFRNLIEVSWYNESPAYQFDNIVANAVPIPGAVWLLGSGIVGLVAVRRRKSQ